MAMSGDLEVSGATKPRADAKANIKRLVCEEEDKGNADINIVASVTFARMAVLEPRSVYNFEAHVKQCQLRQFTFDYYTHGLVEEAGEVFEAVSVARLVAAHRLACNEKVLSEMGDVLWYANSFSLEVGIPLAMPTIWPTVKAGVHNPKVLMRVAVARLSGRVKKSMRGDKPLEQFVSAMLQYRDELLARCTEVIEAHPMMQVLQAWSTFLVYMIAACNDEAFVP
jgi:NTP pyrophosphatase (non-canonical NTP hydrolase)